MKSTSPLIQFLYLGLGMLLMITSCTKEEIELTELENGSLNPEFAIPIGYANLDAKDILNISDKQGAIHIDPDGMLRLIYKGNLLSIPAQQVLNFPNAIQQQKAHVLSSAEAAAFNALPLGGKLVIQDSVIFNFASTGSAELSELKLKQTQLDLNAEFFFNQTGKIDVSIPQAKKQGLSYTSSLPILSQGSSSKGVASDNMNNYVLDLTLNNSTYNKLKVNVSIELTKGSGTVNAGDPIQFDASFRNLNYFHAIGYLGQLPLTPIGDTVSMPVFKNGINKTGATFNFKNPKINVLISNSYGFPLSGSFTELAGYTPGLALKPVTGAPNPLSLPQPASLGQTGRSSFELNTTNSNIYDFINDFPHYLIYKTNVQANSGGKLHTNFLTDSSRFEVDAEVELPFHGTMLDYIFRDTLAFDFESVDVVESAVLRIVADNNFPVDMRMFLSMVDTNYTLIHKLIIPGHAVLKSAPVDASGKTIGISQSITDFEIPKEVLPRLGEVKHLILGAAASTTNNATSIVKIYNSNYIFARVGLKVKTNVTGK